MSFQVWNYQRVYLKSREGQVYNEWSAFDGHPHIENSPYLTRLF